MKESCGALLYTVRNGRIGLILGFENNHWLPFKGCKEDGETVEEAAIREVYEETGALVCMRSIKCWCSFETKRKRYHLGCIYADYDIIDMYQSQRSTLHGCFKEKTTLKFFALNSTFHPIVMRALEYYRKFLEEQGRRLLCNKPLLRQPLAPVVQPESALATPSEFDTSNSDGATQ